MYHTSYQLLFLPCGKFPFNYRMVLYIVLSTPPEKQIYPSNVPPNVLVISYICFPIVLDIFVARGNRNSDNHTVRPWCLAHLNEQARMHAPGRMPAIFVGL